MEARRDFISGQKPTSHSLYYNGDDDADSNTLRYKGSLVKATDWDNSDGGFLTWAGESTAYENIFGILEEEQEASATTNYLPNDVAFGMNRRKIMPVTGTTIIRAQIAEFDPTGTDLTVTGASGSAASTTFTSGENSSDAYTNIGCWLYFTNGSNANFLHYVESHTSASPMVYTLGKALVGAVVSADNFLVIQPHNTRFLNFDAHEVVIASKELVSARTVPIFGLDTWFTDVGFGLTKLDRNKHDGLKLVKPRFYHDFLLIGNTTLTNVFTGGLIYS